MSGIERLTRKVCDKMQNPDMYIEKSALNVEKLGDKRVPDSLEKAQRLLSQAQTAQGRASVQIQMNAYNKQKQENLNKLK